MTKRSILLPALVVLSLAAAPAAAHAATTLQPGAYHETDAGSCTLNFAYTGPSGETLLGTAAHCVDKVGQRVRDIDGVGFGSVSFVGDATSSDGWDFAFIKVDSEDVSRVRASVKGHPGYPKGATTTTETAAGDQIQISGYGLGYGTTQPTQEQRRAILTFDDADLAGVAGPIHWGDSGGPLVHIKTGKALGIVIELCVGTCTEMGPTVRGLIAKAASRGYRVTLKTV